MTLLAQHLLQLAPEQGYNKTRLKGVGVFRADQSSEPVPLCYSQGIIIVAQGRKKVFLEQQCYEYNPDNYLVLTLPLPAECETLVEPGEHMLSLIIDIDLAQLSELVRLFDEHRQLGSDVGQLADSKGLYLGQMNQSFSATAVRLAQCLHSPLDADVLGQGLVREILFHVLNDPQAGPLFSLAMHNTHMARLERALKHMHSHYEQALDVDQLAGLANMSTSAFHRNFRQVTASSPIQYLKKLRLTRARELLLDQGLKVKQAAAMVGYDSPTQFSREFKRYFGQSPQQFVPR